MTLDLINFFENPDYADEWVRITRDYFCKWVEEHGKSYYDMTRFYWHYKGVLKPLSRSNYARLLFENCRDGLTPTDTMSSLEYNMEKFLHKDHLRRRSKAERKKERPDAEYVFETKGGSTAIIRLIAELDSLYQKAQEEKDTTPQAPTIELRIKEMLEVIREKEPYAAILENPTYGAFSPAIAYEQYHNQKFMESRQPSHIEAYEFVHEQVDVDKICLLSGRYQNDRRIKLNIVSEHGYDVRCQNVAQTNNIALIRVDPSRPVTEACFVTPRSVAVHQVDYANRQMLLGRQTMDTPFVIYSNATVTTSICDVLVSDGIKIDDRLCLKAPHLKDDEIELRALEWVKAKVDDFVSQICKYPWTGYIPYFDAEPEHMLKRMGYSITVSDMLDTGQLALIDMKNKIVTLGEERSNIYSRYFSLSHEGGHANLHYAQNIEAFGENEQTVTPRVFVSKTEYQWLEHQANHFASCLLMPEDVVGYLYYVIYKKNFPNRKIEPLYLGNQPCQQRDFIAVARPMAEHMHVSIEALKHRLLKLELAIDVASSYKRIRNVM